jgi:glycosyltransferase involved in cell wall biosynthesis
MPKKKILWVVYDFVQAGGQRYVYEICKALDKEKYQIDFLKAAPLNHDKNWDNEFYYQPTLDLGCRIILLEDVLKSGITSIKEKIKHKFYSVLKLETSTISANDANKRLQDFFNRYDALNFSGVAVYETTCIDKNLHPENAFIHILTFGFQHPKMYEGYDKSVNYKFISPVTPGAVKKDLIDFNNYNFTYFPLCFETRPYDLIKKSRNSERFKIAIFTRLSAMKPLDPFFYSLKILLEQGVDVELNIYGSGNPSNLGMIKQLEYLYLKDYVKFMGHSDSIPGTLKENTPDLLWFQSANKEPGGYAAFEISMSGLPQLFWDFMDTGEKREIGEIFPSFTNINSFVAFTKQVLMSENLQKELGENQRQYVLKNYSIKNHIHILEELFDK